MLKGTIAKGHLVLISGLPVVSDKAAVFNTPGWERVGQAWLLFQFASFLAPVTRTELLNKTKKVHLLSRVSQNHVSTQCHGLSLTCRSPNDYFRPGSICKFNYFNSGAPLTWCQVICNHFFSVVLTEEQKRWNISHISWVTIAMSLVSMKEFLQTSAYCTDWMMLLVNYHK